MRDHVHGIQGEWNYRRCENRRCGLVWLDPPILESDLPLLFAEYFTHRRSGRAGGGRRARWARRVRDGYVRMRFGPHHEPIRRSAKLFGALAYLFPIRRMRLEAEYAYLRSGPEGAGRLLEIGCGHGERLQRLASCGWSASGVDFDALAVDTCRQHGLDVRLGRLEDQRFDPESFDAIVLNHVIEHVADPVRLLEECVRVARPGARLVMVTPNAGGALHRVFGRFWRGLEAPRHLRVFSGPNLTHMS
ncbi:MAG: class I SAM-dependent methyltransferase, partial [Panacagrimonas sp.]